MEDRVLVGLFQSSRRVNEALKASLEDGLQPRSVVLSGLSALLRHVSQSLLVLVSLDRTSDSNSTPWSSRFFDSLVENLYRLITNATKGVAPRTLKHVYSGGRGGEEASALLETSLSGPPHASVGTHATRSLSAASSQSADRADHNFRGRSAEEVPLAEPSFSTTVDANTTVDEFPRDSTTDVLSVAPLSWSELVYGCEEAIIALQHALILPRRFPQFFGGRQRAPWRRILLYGPPGTGKTHLVHVAAEVLDCALISISAADLLSKWIGESEKQVRHVFDVASQHAQCIVFLDELDALCGVRGASSETEASRRLKTELLLQLQALPANVTLIAATNLPWEIDTAVRRRFDRFVYVGMPSASSRRRLLAERLRGIASNLSDEELGRVVDATTLYSTSDMIHAVDHAVLMPLECLITCTACRLATEKEEGELVRTQTHPCRTSQPSTPCSPDEPLSLSFACTSHVEGGDRGQIQWPLFVPCASNDPRALPHLTIDDVPPLQLLTPPLTFQHVMAALSAYPPSTTEAELLRIQQWGQRVTKI